MLLAAPALVARTGAPRLGVAMEIAAPRVVVSPFVRSTNPATGEVLETFQETAADELARILECADAASREWCRTPAAERAERLRAAARVLRERKDTYARTMALEMGKPLAQGVAEAE